MHLAQRADTLVIVKSSLLGEIGLLGRSIENIRKIIGKSTTGTSTGHDGGRPTANLYAFVVFVFTKRILPLGADPTDALSVSGGAAGIHQLGSRICLEHLHIEEGISGGVIDVHRQAGVKFCLCQSILCRTGAFLFLSDARNIDASGPMHDARRLSSTRRHSVCRGNSSLLVGLLFVNGVDLDAHPETRRSCISTGGLRNTPTY
mmetsp:Transcript_25511/g.59660  ORF Transcript_25511/g.59660 Transcript_25511/m.59660 type:complete len:204 (-) Transcript_25511:374-985(-)